MDLHCHLVVEGDIVVVAVATGNRVAEVGQRVPAAVADAQANKVEVTAERMVAAAIAQASTVSATVEQTVVVDLVAPGNRAVAVVLARTEVGEDTGILECLSGRPNPRMDWRCSAQQDSSTLDRDLPDHRYRTYPEQDWVHPVS
jgi:hypothetical protein